WHASPSLGSATQFPVVPPVPTHSRPKSHSNSEVHTAFTGLSATHMLFASQNAELTQSTAAQDSPILASTGGASPTQVPWQHAMPHAGTLHRSDLHSEPSVHAAPAARLPLTICPHASGSAPLISTRSEALVRSQSALAIASTHAWA